VIVGFCTTAMNRRWQIEQTLPVNLARLRETGCFLALCDYNSADDLQAFVRGFDNDLADGTLLYFHTGQPRGYHSSKAKNLAHRLAITRRPDVLFNLDADNYVSDQTLDIVAAALSGAGEACLHNWSTRDDDGSSGRIALRTDTWRRLGGYDETFAPASWQDLDLLMRCRAAGVPYVLDPRGVPPPVPNTMADKVRHLEPPGDGSPPQPPDVRYRDMFRHNVLASLARPSRLPLEQQQRFEGRLNFQQPLTL
jgi:hypothetical protein